VSLRSMSSASSEGAASAGWRGFVPRSLLSAARAASLGSGWAEGCLSAGVAAAGRLRSFRLGAVRVWKGGNSLFFLFCKTRVAGSLRREARPCSLTRVTPAGQRSECGTAVFPGAPGTGPRRRRSPAERSLRWGGRGRGASLWLRTGVCRARSHRPAGGSAPCDAARRHVDRGRSRDVVSFFTSAGGGETTSEICLLGLKLLARASFCTLC